MSELFASRFSFLVKLYKISLLFGLLARRKEDTFIVNHSLSPAQLSHKRKFQGTSILELWTDLLHDIPFKS